MSQSPYYGNQFTYKKPLGREANLFRSIQRIASKPPSGKVQDQRRPADFGIFLDPSFYRELYSHPHLYGKLSVQIVQRALDRQQRSYHAQLQPLADLFSKAFPTGLLKPEVANILKNSKNRDLRQIYWTIQNMDPTQVPAFLAALTDNRGGAKMLAGMKSLVRKAVEGDTEAQDQIMGMVYAGVIGLASHYAAPAIGDLLHPAFGSVPHEPPALGRFLHDFREATQDVGKGTSKIVTSAHSQDLRISNVSQANGKRLSLVDVNRIKNARPAVPKISLPPEGNLLGKVSDVQKSKLFGAKQTIDSANLKPDLPHSEAFTNGATRQYWQDQRNANPDLRPFELEFSKSGTASTNSAEPPIKLLVPGEGIRYEVPEVLRKSYLSRKRGDNSGKASFEDIVQILSEPNPLAHFTLADRTINGHYHNPETGASVRLYGGPDTGLDQGQYGRIAWANSTKGAATRIINGAAKSNGLVIVYNGSLESALSSRHSIMVLLAEAEAALQRFSEAEVRLIINDGLSRSGFEPITNISDLGEHFNDISMPVRNRLVRNIMNKQQQVLPSYDKVVKYMSVPELLEARTGDIATLLYVDPDGVAGLAKDVQVPIHPAYDWNIPGINLGRTAPNIHLTDILQDMYEGAWQRRLGKYRSRESFYPQWRFSFEKKGGMGQINEENLFRLTGYQTVRNRFRRSRPQEGVAEYGPAAEGTLHDPNAGDSRNGWFAAGRSISGSNARRRRVTDDDIYYAQEQKQNPSYWLQSGLNSLMQAYGPATLGLVPSVGKLAPLRIGASDFRKSVAENKIDSDRFAEAVRVGKAYGDPHLNALAMLVDIYH